MTYLACHLHKPPLGACPTENNNIVVTANKDREKLQLQVSHSKDNFLILIRFHRLYLKLKTNFCFTWGMYGQVLHLHNAPRCEAVCLQGILSPETLQVYQLMIQIMEVQARATRVQCYAKPKTLLPSSQKPQLYGLNYVPKKLHIQNTGQV